MPDTPPVPAELARFFQSKNLRPSFSYREVWGEEHRLAFTVAKVLNNDLLSEFRTQIIRAQQEGIPFKQFARDIAPALERAGWWSTVSPNKEPSKKTKARRLQIVYDTNLRMARAHGQWERIQRRKRVQPYLRYRLGPSEKHRPEHAAKDGLIYPADHPFWRQHFPPNGYGCKCWAEQLTRRQAEALGGVSANWDEQLFPPTTYRDPRSGKERTTPFGVAPGFEFAPGLAGRQAGVNQALAESK